MAQASDAFASPLVANDMDDREEAGMTPRRLDARSFSPVQRTLRVAFLIVVATMAGALAERRLGRECAPMFGGIIALMPSAPISIAGAIAGFFVSIVLAALFFLLIEIAHNTRNPFSP